MQRDSDEDLQEQEDSTIVTVAKHVPQSWRSTNGILISKKSKELSASSKEEKGYLLAERHLIADNLETNTEQESTTAECTEADGSTRKNINRSIRGGNLIFKESAGQRNARSQVSGGQLINNDKMKVTPLTHLLLYSEDMRISKILRRLMGEKNPSVAVELCKKLEIAVRTPANTAYICRSFDLLLEQMIAMLRQGPLECLERVSNILGLIGYINRSNFPTYRNYLTKAFQSSHGVEKYIMLALKTTFSCDAVNLDLSVYSESLLRVLKDYLENAVVAEIFIAVSETIAEFSKNYKREFTQHFTDIVDIVVGWHLEAEQPQKLKMHCSQVLQQFSSYFVKELDFTFGLLGQFLEDIMAFEEDISAESSSLKMRQKAEVRFGTFVGAFTSILKSLATRTDFVAFSTGQAVISEAIALIVETAQQMYTQLEVNSSEETVLNVNDFLCLIYTYSFNAADLPDTIELIRLQLRHLHYYNEQQQISLLCLVLCMVRRMRTQLPCALVTVVFHVAPPNPLAQLKLTKNERLYKLLLRIYHEVLIIKNVPLLQEAYKHITMDIEVALNDLTACEGALKCTIAATTFNFNLSALSALATQTSSIIGMYALNPSILDLLICKCQAANLALWEQHTTLHNALLQVLVVHCQKNHNFMPSSRILTENHEKSSPTSENFGTILKFLAEILHQYEKLCGHNLDILLKWLHNLLEACKESAHLLAKHEHFGAICQHVVAAAQKSPMACASCIDVLIEYSTLSEQVLLDTRNVAICLLDSYDQDVKQTYASLYAKLPLRITLANRKLSTSTITGRRQQLHDLQIWYKTTQNNALFRQKYFKPFLGHLKIPQINNLDYMNIEETFLGYFNKCWTVQVRPDVTEYQQMVCRSAKMLSLWVQFETARYCVRNKLRTTMGKPQDTFLAIEAIIMKYARLLTSEKEQSTRDKEGGSNAPATANSTMLHSLQTQRNIRRLLAFITELEKLIYNAAEGTAFAILPPEKPAKTFFRINSHTCQEWYKRISPGINIIALNSMEYEMVIHFSENMLKADKLNEARIEHTVTSLVWALLCCEEADTLRGLYAWLKAKTGKRYAWIQCAAEQALGHREQAAEGYVAVLSETNNKMDTYTREFLSGQLLHCLYSTAQWSKMRSVARAMPKISTAPEIALNIFYNDKHLELMEALCLGHSEDASVGGSTNNSSNRQMQRALLALSEWQIDRTDEPAETGFSYYNILHQLENACISSTLREDNTFSPILPPDVVSAMQLGLEESWQHGCVLKRNSQQTDFVLLNHITQQLHKCPTHVPFAALDCSSSVEKSEVLLKCLQWSLLFEQRFPSVEHGYKPHHRLYLDVASCARSEGNSNFCRSMLQQFFALKGFTEPLLVVAEHVQSSDAYTIDMEDEDLLRGFCELSKCMYVSPRNLQQEAINLGAGYCHQIIQQVQTVDELLYPTSSSNMLLTLSEWLTQRSHVSSVISSAQVQRLLNALPELPVPITEGCSPTSIPAVERAVGKLLNGSIMQKSDSGEAWWAFGNWCYRWGKKSMEARNTESYASNQNTISLSQRDISAIKDKLGADVGEQSMLQLLQVLYDHPLNTLDGMEDLEATNEVATSSTEQLEQALSQLKICSKVPPDVITNIVDVWRQAHKNVYAYYELATKAYFKYLAIETEQSAQKRTGHETGKAGAAHASVGDSTFVTTTLRILRLIVKHAIGLQEVLEEGLSSTPLRPWKVIIPQLFSRLNHHELYVRKSVSDLLCRLAQERPHLVIFPAVVGAQQEQLTTTKSATPNETSKALEQPSSTSNSLSTSFRSLLQTLSRQAPETVLHVQMLVKELKRITLLWEEYWIHSLAQLYSDYAPLFNTLEQEAKKCTSDKGKLQLHYNVLIGHVVSDLQKIAEVTEKPPETNYERCFQERYAVFINNTISELQKAVVDWSKPTESWLRIKQLYAVFQQRALRGSATASMKIADLSPALALMRNTTISMPGVDTNEMQSVCIKAVESTVYVLPTKTKPKKLAFYGSDGRKYTYLFKGLEDLHLDERIMQFLSIANSMMARANDSLCTTNCFKAQHYSVIPLGPQSGLISWVDGVTPLFAIYKKWQQRDAALKQQQKDQRSLTAGVPPNGEPSSTVAPTRPSEIFYNKLTPLLAEHNIKVTDPRKQWPLSTLRRVLDELCKETPRDLLSKELWCYANTATHWRKSVRSYAISMAVMSVIGYVIGLGDRHLDNVLIKLSTGEILHIDYNVCFEKGKTLRVPEKVPFRMTPNLEEALGITGIEGAFRLGCEHVLKILRKERETLLTLLEAFVYDPLVDWTVSDESASATATARTTTAHLAAQRINALNLPATGASVETNLRIGRSQELTQRKQDWEAARQSIAVKINEIKPCWSQYKDEIQLKLMKIDNELEYLSDTQLAIKQAEQERDSLTKQLAMIHELEALGTARGSHALNTITKRYATYKSAASAFNAVKQNVQKYRADIKILLTNYFEKLVAPPTASSELMLLQYELCDQQQNVYSNEFEVMQDFLDQAADEQVYAQCDFARKEMDNTIYQETRTAMECLDLLLQYVSVMQYYPRAHLQHNHLIKYEQWYRQLLYEERDAVVVRQDVEQWLQTEFQTYELQESSRAIQYATEMEKVWMGINFELHKVINALNDHKQEELYPVEIAISDIQSFLNLGPEHVSGVHLSLLHTLTQANEAFKQFEDMALLSSDAVLLDQQIDFLELVQSLCNATLTEAVALQERCACLHELYVTLVSLRKLKSAFELPMLERMVHLFMLQTDTELQAMLNLMCTTPTSVHELVAQDDQNKLNEPLHALVREIFDLFTEYEQELQKLQQFTRGFNEHTNKEEFEDYMDLKIRNCNLNLLVGTTKFETIAQLFRNARDQVTALRENTVELIYDTNFLATPITDYINQQQKSLLGGLIPLLTTSLQDGLSAACYNAVHIDENTLANAQLVVQNLVAALQHGAVTKNWQQQVLLHTKLVEHYRLVATAHFWANEQHLHSESVPLYGHIIYKDKLISSLQNVSQSLGVWKHTLTKIQADIEEHVASVIKLLDCCAIGSTQETQTLQACFMQQVDAQKLRSNFHQQLVNKLVDYSSVLLQFELLSERSSAYEADSAFLTIVAQWQETYANWRHCGAVITPVEQDIVQLLDPEGKVDQCWIENISGLLDDMTFSVQRRLATLEHAAHTHLEQLNIEASNMQPIIDAQIRPDVRQLLKMIVRSDKNAANSGIEAMRVRELQHGIKLFYTKIGELQMHLTSSDPTFGTLDQMRKHIAELLDVNAQNNSELMQLLQRLLQSDRSSVGTGASGASSGDNKSCNPATGSMPTTGDKKANATQSEQKRNAYAVSVWKRIRMKLEGRDPDPNCRSTVAEQADFIIREATNADNLAVLYEGWTPWV